MELYGLNTIGLQRAGFSARDGRRPSSAPTGCSSTPTSTCRRRWSGPGASCPPCPRSSASSTSSSPRERGVPGVSAPLPVGVIGVGALGRHHARHLAQLRRRSSWSACYDIDRGPRRGGGRGARHPGLRATSTRCWRAVEAVSIAVPTPAHAEVGLRALERGVAGADGEAARRHAGGGRRADRGGGARRACSSRSGTSSASTARSARRGAVPATIRGTSRATRLAPFQPRGTDVAVVLDLMIHDLDLVLHLTGGAEATDVRASGLAVLSLPPRPGERAGRVRQRRRRHGHRLAGSRASGCAGSGSSSRTATSRSTWPAGGGEFLRRPAATGRPAPAPSSPTWWSGSRSRRPRRDALALELASFVHAVRGERDAVVTGAEGRAALALALRVTDAVRRRPLAAPAGG